MKRYHEFESIDVAQLGKEDAVQHFAWLLLSLLGKERKTTYRCSRSWNRYGGAIPYDEHGEQTSLPRVSTSVEYRDQFGTWVPMPSVLERTDWRGNPETVFFSPDGKIRFCGIPDLELRANYESWKAEAGVTPK